jgi:hypothetical protein
MTKFLRLKDIIQSNPHAHVPAVCIGTAVARFPDESARSTRIVFFCALDCRLVT